MMQQFNSFLDKIYELSHDSKYRKWYVSIIEKSINRVNIIGYFEKHHILPRSLGGSNDRENLATLTAKEHFICHLLLSKMLIDKNYRKKMVYAALMLRKSINQNQDGRITSKKYEYLTKMLSEISSGENNYFYGKKHTDESRKKIGEKSKGRIPGEKTRDLMSKAKKGKKRDRLVVEKCVASRLANGYKHSQETKDKLSESHQGKKTGKCWNRGKTKETDSSVAKISESCKGRIPWNKDINENDPRRQNGEKNGFYGKTHTEEMKKHLKEKAKNREKFCCEYCGKEMVKTNYIRWHGNKCKVKI